MRFQWVADSKGLAILAVIIYHACIIAGLKIIPHGDMGVDVFVILSGFGLALNERDESLASFWIRRLLQIGPRYWVCLILFLIIYRLTLGSQPTWTQILIQGVFGNLFVNTIAGAWWFLTLIAGLYIIYGFLRPVIKKGDVGLLLAIGLCLLYLLIYVLGRSFGLVPPSGIPANTNGIYCYVCYRIMDFFLGIVLALIVRKKARFSAASSLLAGMLGLYWFYWCTSVDAWLLIYPAGGMVLLAVFSSLSMALRATGSAIVAYLLTWLGTCSYELYLIHHPLMQTLNFFWWQRLGVPNPTRTQITEGMAAALVITIVMAYGLSRIQAFKWLSVSRLWRNS